MIDINLNLNELDQSLLKKLDNYVDSLENPEGSLINILHRAQKIFGHIPHNLQLYISRKVNVSAARVNGVVSFYSYFNEEKTGDYLISVCMGTACYVKGAEKVLHKLLEELDIEQGKTTEDGKFTIKDVRCIGACGLAPVVTINEDVFGHITKVSALELLDSYRGEK
ncbi:MAG: NAD(P)H-dependent oxidoreductase subunit E [Candidatus Izimaplasma sp.]|nr:NAD(P)H-dependent oxidoreductase subunit E [Candidatus Izimaplasma bacterium]